MNDCEPALVPYIIFSDSVIREMGTGKLSFIGSFQQFNAIKFPLAVPPFFITARITNLHGDLEKIRLTVRLEEPHSGLVVCNMGAEVVLPEKIKRGSDIEIPFPMTNVVFQHQGNYDVTILLNNELVGKRPISVRSVPSGPPQIDIKKEDEL
jgi:hypothetical protein